MAQRRKLIAAAGVLTHCPRCGRPISKANPITAEHTLARSQGGVLADTLICRVCNSKGGGVLSRRNRVVV